MKQTKVIIPALGLLLLSTAASVTGTVAWFAANTTVTANGMSVTVKSDSSFLLIKQGSATASQIQASKLISDSAVTASAQLLPCAHEAEATTISTIDATTGEEPNKTMTNWYYYYSDNPASYAAAGSKHTIAENKFSSYVLANEFSLTIAVGGNQMNDVRVNECTITQTDSGAQAVKVLVATSTASQEFSGTGAQAGSTPLQAALTDQTVMSVKIYIYWDGADTDVYSNNIANLKNTSVVVTFTGTVA